MSSICTFTGKSFSYENICAKNICIEDMAHALSNLCRYAGQAKKFYSVAEHCVLLSRADNMPGTPLARLLHDAVEAYVVDLPRPLKNLLPNYKHIENEIAVVIAEKYGVDFGPVKPGDTKMIEIEAPILMHENFFEIHNKNNTYKLAPRCDPAIEIIGWSPNVAAFEFITRAGILGAVDV